MPAPSYRLPLGALVLALAGSLLPVTAAEAAPPPGTPVLHQTAELVSEPIGGYSRQGSDVALSADGSTLAVANVMWNDGEHPSTVVVYARSGGGWIRQTTLRQPPALRGNSTNWAAAIALSADGDTLAVVDMTARVWPGGRPTTGVVHLLTRTGQSWRITDRLVAPDSRPLSWFGLDVSLSADGTRVAVGGDGRAYVGDTRSHVVQELLEPAGETPAFGSTVAISPDGTTVVVGSPGGGALRNGAASVFVDDPAGGWTRRWHLEPRPGERSRSFGAALAITDGDTVVVGAHLGAPSVSVFDRRGAALVRTARFKPRFPTQARFLGYDVAVSADGSTVVAGAFGRDTTVNRSDHAGAGYRWVRSPGGWSWAGLLSTAHPTAGGDQGWSTAMSADGRVVVLGSPGRWSHRRGRTGAAIVFSAVP